MPPHIMLLTTLVLILQLCEGNRVYEFKRLTATTSIQYFTSPNYPASYPSNHTSEWLISTGYINHTVMLVVVDCRVEHEIKHNRCLYENITIYDGNSTNGSVMTPMEGYCCLTNHTTYRSTQSQMYVQFITDSSNVDRGFNISYFSDGPTTTTQTTTTTTTIPTSMIATPTINAGSSSNENWKYIVAGCASGLVLIGTVITLCICYLWCKKVNTVQSLKQRPTSATCVRPASSEENQKVIPADADISGAPDTGEKNCFSFEQTQNPVFEIDTPIAKANVLAPIESRLM